ncbi:MAG: hypothetical protein HYY06_22830 [Deltaproteobacteria bacterium]|nr:hypothetical protein [Deltaproteobacteria bacterium]
MRSTLAAAAVLAACSGQANGVPTISIDGCLAAGELASLRIDVASPEGDALATRCFEATSLPQTAGLEAEHFDGTSVLVEVAAFSDADCGGEPAARATADVALAGPGADVVLDPACDSSCACPCGQCPSGAGAADVLFIVDNSNSMVEEQAALTAAFPRLLGAIGPRVEDLHVGVVSTDLGTGPVPLVTCEDTDGDDGALLHQASPLLEGCAAEYPAFLSGSPDGLTSEFACLATLGTGGCGVEQPLEAMRLALTERAAEGQPNAGFLRDGAVAAIVVLTDEDDCSMRDPTILEGDPEAPHLRCIERADGLWEPSRYVAVIEALGRPVVFAAIAGVPAGWDGSLDALEPTVDPENPTSLLPICTGPGGLAYPGRRVAEMAGSLDPPGLVRSICDGAFDDAMAAVGDAIAAAAAEGN